MIEAIIDDHDAVLRQQRLGLDHVILVALFVAVDENEIEQPIARQPVDDIEGVAVEQLDLGRKPVELEIAPGDLGEASLMGLLTASDTPTMP